MHKDTKEWNGEECVIVLVIRSTKRLVDECYRRDVSR